MCKKSCFLNSKTVGDRKVIIWGAGALGEEMARLLNSYGYEIEGFVDSYLGGEERILCGLPVHNVEYLEGKQDSLFVLVSMGRNDEDVREYLYEQNYTEISDFCWLNRTPIEPEVKDGVYQDDFGNVLNIRCEASKLKVTLMGKNNHLDIDDSVYIKDNVTVYLTNGSEVSLRDVSVYGLNNINVVNRSRLAIDGKSTINVCTMNIQQSSSLAISAMSLEDGSSLEVSHHSICTIADGVMGGICKITAYSALSMEQVYSKAKKIFVYRKGSLQIEKTKLEEDIKLAVGDAAKACIFNSKIGQVSDIIAHRHSVLDLKQVCLKETEIKIKDYAEAVMEKSTFGKKARIAMTHNTKIKIYSMETREGASILGYFDSEIYIGHNCKVNKNLYILVNHGSSLTVGRDCGFSQDVTILSGDSHPVFQIDHPHIYEACSRVRILDHVWLGKSSVVLGHAVIGEGCIVAPNSVVGKKYPNNCLLMGYPARIIKKNVAYDLDECNPDAIADRRYWKQTDLEN